MKKADLILCGDIHIRESVPICRTDDFFTAQWKKLSFIKDLQIKHNCPVLCSGDLFDHWKPSPELLSNTINFLPENFHTVYGNHDLPNHNLELESKCGAFTLWQAQIIGVFNTCHFGNLPEEESITIKGKKILVWHKMVYKNELPFPGCTDPKARSILHNYPQFDLILTGDNHQPFTQEYKGRLLVNPGSMMRQEAGQIDYKPAVWLWYAETNTVEPVYLPIVKNTVTREHLEVAEKRESRIHAFVETLNTKGMDAISFEKNLEVFFQQNTIREDIKEITYKMLEQ